MTFYTLFTHDGAPVLATNSLVSILEHSMFAARLTGRVDFVVLETSYEGTLQSFPHARALLDATRALDVRFP